jgi:hypothetical protein
MTTVRRWRSHEGTSEASQAQAIEGSQAPDEEARRRTAHVRGGRRRQSRDPFHAARIARLESGERFDDATEKSDDPWVREVSVHPDCEGGIHWLVEWGDSDGGCYVTVFDGPLAELRARDYFGALIAGRLRVLREIG